MVGAKKRTSSTAEFFADQLVRKKKKVGIVKLSKRAKDIGVQPRELIDDIISELKKQELNEMQLDEIEKRFIDLTTDEKAQILSKPQKTKLKLSTEERNKALLKLTVLVGEELNRMDPKKSKKIRKLFAEVIQNQLDRLETKKKESKKS